MGRKAVFCLLYFLAVVFTGLLLAAAVLSWRASFVSPEQGGFWATIALLMPVVLLANLAALVWWLIRRRWVVALMPLAALLLNMGYVSSMIQLPDFNVSDGSHDIRIATLNVNGFRQLGPKSITAAAVAEMMRHEQVDVLCLQEFLDDSRFTADSIGELFSRRMPYFVSEGNGAVASRYPDSRLANTSGFPIPATTTCAPTCSSREIRCAFSRCTSRLRASPSCAAASRRTTTGKPRSIRCSAPWTATAGFVPRRCVKSAPRRMRRPIR